MAGEHGVHPAIFAFGLFTKSESTEAKNVAFITTQIYKSSAPSVD